jgi:hypothetical protein
VAAVTDETRNGRLATLRAVAWATLAALGVLLVGGLFGGVLSTAPGDPGDRTVFLALIGVVVAGTLVLAAVDVVFG